MNLNTTKHFINELDRERLVGAFAKYFKMTNNPTDVEKMASLVKAELSEVHSMRRLVMFTGFEIEEFVYHTIALYPHIFNKSFIRKVKNNVKAGFEG